MRRDELAAAGRRADEWHREHPDEADEHVRKLSKALDAALWGFDCGCDPDVWGPDGLERGTGHNPACINAVKAHD